MSTVATGVKILAAAVAVVPEANPLPGAELDLCVTREATHVPENFSQAGVACQARAGEYP